MLEGDLYIDPEEDEVFFPQFASEKQLEKIAKLCTRKSFQGDDEEDKENIPCNISVVLNKSVEKKDVDVLEKSSDACTNQRPCPSVASLNQSDFEIDLNQIDAPVNESLLSWCSIDVNTQMRSLTADFDLEDEDEEIENKEVVKEDPPLNDDFSKSLPCSTPKSAPFPKPKIEEDESQFKNLTENLPSSTPKPSPFAVPTSTKIPKSIKSASKIPAPKSGSKIPRSLTFTHVKSPLKKYIDQTSTPLICNKKTPVPLGPKQSQAAASVSGTKITRRIITDGPNFQAAKANSQPELRAACYQKGIPSKHEKPSEGRLPHLGPVQLKTIKPLSPQIVKHQSRLCGVSILVSQEAKMTASPKK